MITGGGLNANAKMRHLSPEHFEQVVEWALQGMPMERVAELCKKELNLPPAKIPSLTALYGFWRSFGPFWLSARRRVAAAAAMEAGAEARRSPVNFKDAIADAIEQTTFELLSDPNLDAKTVRAFVTATLKLHDQDLERRKLKLLEQKMQDAKDALTKIVSKGGLTPETRQEIEQSLALL